MPKYTDAQLLTDGKGQPIPQYYDPSTDSFKALTDPTQVNVANQPTVNAQLTGSSLQEQLTNADAVNGVVTFADFIKNIEIYNKDTVNDGVFTVNGIKITVPAGEVFQNPIGGTPGKTVTITGSTSYILGRYA